MAALLPEPLLPALAEPLLLAPLTALLDGSHAAMHRLLLVQAQGGNFRQLLQLHKLGRALGIEAWQEPVLQLMLASSTAGAASAAADHEGAASSSTVLQQGFDTASSQAAAAAAAEPAAVEELLRSIMGGSESAAEQQRGAAGQQHEAGQELAAGLGEGQRQRQQQQDDWELLDGCSPRSDAAGGPSDSHAGAEAPQPATAAAAGEAATAGSAAGGPTPQQLVIESIQQGEFGVGLELGSEAGALASRQNERIGRALKRLSRDLYSKDTHFVLELVQVGGSACVRGLWWWRCDVERARVPPALCRSLLLGCCTRGMTQLVVLLLTG
jgi:hypothetical protein